MLQWIAAGFSILGNIFNIRKSRWGFVLWIIGNGIWVYIGYTTKQWGLLFLFTVYTGMSTWGFIEWSRK